jgi:hypothetical protein
LLGQESIKVLMFTISLQYLIIEMSVVKAAASKFLAPKIPWLY